MDFVSLINNLPSGWVKEMGIVITAVIFVHEFNRAFKLGPIL